MSEKEAEMMTPMERKLFEIRLKINAGRKQNKEQAKLEHERLTNPQAYKKKTTKNEEEKKQPERKRQPPAAEKDAFLSDLPEEAHLKHKKQKKKQKQAAAFGWDVFNQNALYNAYKKRLDQLPTSSSSVGKEDGGDWKELEYGKNDQVDKKGAELMVKELEQRAANRKKFSRRRQHYEGKDVDYINDRNAHFNKKIARAFDKYTVEIRQNLERGTAL